MLRRLAKVYRVIKIRLQASLQISQLDMVSMPDILNAI